MEKQNNRSAFVFITLGILFIIMKGLFYQADNNDLRFMTLPVDVVISFFFNSESLYSLIDGYVHADMNISIDKSCSGGNFFIICFLLISLVWLQKPRNLLGSIGQLVKALVLTWICTIAVNVSRIILSLYTIDIVGSHIPWMHQFVGGVVYLSFLVGIYLVIHSSFFKIRTL